jgi:hypothetical protein
MKRIFVLGMALAIGSLLATPASAATSANAVITDMPDGTNFDYTISLTNTGTTTIGTFWFAWVPGQDFMQTSPTNIGQPSGWQNLITHDGAGDGFAIQWKASAAGNDLAAGGSATFTFTSSDTPAMIAGDSSFFPGTPVLTSVLYHTTPFSDAGTTFLVTVGAAAVPEPSSLALGLVAVVGSLAWRRLRRRPQA